ncbi:peptide deformylase [Lentisalinibacter salinarum]|uniref:peptide deformylase n=1 Tax=Lentisalinibacter salinarum TaxID=2992239 RepID=UPI00386A3970
MAIRPILRMGDPRLRQVSRPVEAFDTPELHDLIADMFDTMADADGAGLAAPQIAVPLRVMIFGVESNPRYPDAEPVPTTVLVNASYEVLDETQTSGWEGCLSVPGMRGRVPRYRRIRYRGFDPHGEPVEREADGFHAVVFQHEYDHLDGILYPDRIVEKEKFGFERELIEAGVFA